MKIDRVVFWLALTSVVLLALVVVPQLNQLDTVALFSQQSPLKLEMDTVVALELRRDEEVLALKRQDETWVSDAGQLEETELERLLSALDMLTVESVAARSAATYNELGIATSSATVIVLTTSEGERQLEVGANGPRINTFYARWADQTDVYLVENPLRNILSGSFAEFITTQPTVESSASAQFTE